MYFSLYATFLISWGLLFIIFCGCGMWVLRAFNLRLSNDEQIFLSLWCGWALSLAVLQIWNLIFPVNGIIRVILLLCGISGFLWNLGDIWKQIHKPFTWAWAIFFMIFAIWLANRSTAFPYIFDTGLYHLNVMQWAEAYPVVPGLGNLHTRLAFSSTFFLFPALIDIGFWQDKPHHIVNSFLVLSLFTHLISVGSQFFWQAQASVSKIYQLLFIPVLLMYIFRNGYIPGMSNDVPIFILGIIISVQTLEIIINAEIPAVDAFYRLFIVILLAAIGIAIKSTFVVMAGTTALLALSAYIIRFTDKRRLSVLKVTLQAGIAASLIFIPMFVRSIIMTGYPLYPSTLGAFPVEWRIAPEIADLETKIIRAWAMDASRRADEVLSDWSWFSRWFQRMNKSDMVRLPFQITFISAMIFCVAHFLRQFKKRIISNIHLQIMLLFPALISVIVWFFSAPDPRFAGASFWILAFTAFILLLQKIASEESIWRRCIFWTVFMLLMIYPLQDFIASAWLPHQTESGLVELPKADVESFITNSGLVVWNPIDNIKQQCWLAPLPCTPYPDADLMLREIGKIQSGFIMNPASN